MNIEIRHFFDAAHQLPDSEYLITKACARLHGHTYAVIVEASCEPWDIKGGMIVDFKGIKNIIDELDHQFINDIFKKSKSWKDKETTSENIGLYLKERITKEYKYLTNLGVSICEGYKGPERANWTHV